MLNFIYYELKLFQESNFHCADIYKLILIFATKFGSQSSMFDKMLMMSGIKNILILEKL